MSLSFDVYSIHKFGHFQKETQHVLSPRPLWHVGSLWGGTRSISSCLHCREHTSMGTFAAVVILGTE